MTTFDKTITEAEKAVRLSRIQKACEKVTGTMNVNQQNKFYSASLNVAANLGKVFFAVSVCAAIANLGSAVGHALDNSMYTGQAAFDAALMTRDKLADTAGISCLAGVLAGGVYALTEAAKSFGQQSSLRDSSVHDELAGLIEECGLAEMTNPEYERESINDNIELKYNLELFASKLDSTPELAELVQCWGRGIEVRENANAPKMN